MSTRQDDLDRRIDVSADIADIVYTFEDKYTFAKKKGGSDVAAMDTGLKAIEDKLPPKVSIVDSYYDPATGIAAIAVYDSQTGETYIAYAGTNFEADGAIDGISDAQIGLNNPLYLRQLEDRAVGFYDRVQKSGANITVTTGHSYGDFLASRTAIVRDVPYKFGFQGAPQSVSGLTAQEIVVKQMIKMGLKPPQELIDAAKASRVEANRIEKLMQAYSGYGVTFSTTGDQLTNLLWEQSPGEIDYGADLFHAGTSLLIFGASKGLGTKADTRYIGDVVAAQYVSLSQ